MGFLRVWLPVLVFVQGLLLAAAVATRWRHLSNRYLSLFLFLLGLHGLVGLAWQDPTSRLFVVVSTGLSWIPYLYGPVVYRYVWASLFHTLRDPVPFAVHATPALLNIILYAGVLAVVGGDAFAEVGRQVFGGNAPAYVIAMEFGKFVHGVLYSVFVVVLLIRNRAGLRVWSARAERTRWLIFLLVTVTLQWFVALLAGAAIWSGGLDERLTEVIPVVQLLGFLLSFYAISFFTLRYPV